MRSTSAVLALITALGVGLVSSSVRAQAMDDEERPASDSKVLPKDVPAPEPPPEPIEEDFDPSRDHLEVTMGLIGGYADYSGMNFAYRKGGGPVQLVEPFDGAPYDGTLALGMRVELRFVASYIRSTLGVDLPFPNFNQEDTAATYDVDGQSVTISTQSLKHQTFRFGIGGEYSFGHFTPYVDVLGGIHFVETRLATDDQFVNYGNTEFGVSARLGARYSFKKSLFMHGSVMGGLLGPSKVLGELGIGFALL